MDKQTTPVHYLAYLLDPAHAGQEVPVIWMQRAETFLRSHCAAGSSLEVIQDFIDFRAKVGPIFGPGGVGDIYNTTQKPREVWQRMRQFHRKNALAILAV